MSSLSRELVFLILQFLDEEKFKETVHKCVVALLRPSLPPRPVVTCACSVGGRLPHLRVLLCALGDLICHAARLVFRFPLLDEFGGFLGLFLFWFWALMVAAKKKVSLQLGSICYAR